MTIDDQHPEQPPVTASVPEAAKAKSVSNGVAAEVAADTSSDAVPYEQAISVTVEAGEPRVMLYGQPIVDLPQDLYIPPDALSVMLDAFEGPLDLLLYLIRKANVDILDIPMAPLTNQYLDYVEAMRSENLELAAEYLVMAAMLIEIKSRMLLPRPKAQFEEEVEDPRAELVRRLIEYEQMKLAAREIDELPKAEIDFQWLNVWVDREAVVRHPDVSAEDLHEAWRAVVRQAKLHTHHKIAREELSVREHMGIILRRLRTSDSYLEFGELFDVTGGVAVVVVNFIALLELCKEHLLEMTQTAAFAPIYVRLPTDAPEQSMFEVPEADDLPEEDESV
jgi:segregation and condensation protein A